MEENARAPLGYWILAAGCAVVLLALRSTAHFEYGVFSSSVDELGSEALFDRLLTLSDALIVIAPLLALRWLWWGIAAALVLPASVFLVGNGHAFSFTVYLSLLAVAVCGTWRHPRASVLAVAAAMVLPGVAILGWGTMVAPDNAANGFQDSGEAPMYLAMFALAGSVAWLSGVWFRRAAVRSFQGRQALARAGEVEAESAVVAERARLARDLHDVVAHHVSLIAVRAETASYTHPDLDPTARTVLGDIAGDARLALDELRGVLGILGRSGESAERSPQPTWEDIDALVERTRASGSPVVEVGDPGAHPVGAAVGYAAYRVVQESFTNARKHAPGEAVALSLTSSPMQVHVRVATRLPGELSAGGTGRGLAGMRERVESLGGHLVVGPVDDEFVVEATLPQAAG